MSSTVRTRFLYLPIALLGAAYLSALLASCGEDADPRLCSGGGWEEGFISVVDVGTIRLYGVDEAATPFELGPDAAAGQIDTLGIAVEYAYDYYAMSAPSPMQDWAMTGFGLLGTAYATPGPTYTSNGQAFLDVEVLTVRDLDDDHPAGTSVRDLLSVLASPVDTAGFVNEPFFEARLGGDFAGVDTMQFEIVTTVSDGLVLRAQTVPIVVR